MNCYIKSLKNINPNLVIVTGPAGTGKTMNACIEGIKHLRNDNFEKIILTRPSVPIDNEDFGFLPGSLSSKMEPWLIPIYGHLEDYMGKKDLQNYIHSEKIEVCPFAYMRGRTFKNSFIIADEMQNSTPNQFKTILTRLHDSSKLIVTGDLQQSDIDNNGLDDFLNRLPNLEDNDMIKINNLSEIKRGEFVKFVLSLYSF